MSILVWLAAPVIGVVLGLFGAGGGMLSVPVLMYGFGLPIKEAIVISLWFVAVVSMVAALHQRAWRVLRAKLLITFALGGMLGAVLGARVAGIMPDWLLPGKNIGLGPGKSERYLQLTREKGGAFAHAPYSYGQSADLSNTPS